MIQKIKNKIYSFKINNRKYKVDDKIFFKEPIIHPYTKEKITYGNIVRINSFLNPENVFIYLADAISYSNDVNCSSWVRNYKIEELLELVDNSKLKF